MTRPAGEIDEALRIVSEGCEPGARRCANSACEHHVVQRRALGAELPRAELWALYLSQPSCAMHEGSPRA